LYAAVDGGQHGNPQVRLAWFKLSPEGQVLGSDTYSIPDSVRPWSWMHTTNGGGGIVVNVSSEDGPQVASGLKLPGNRASYRSMTATVSREKRIIIVNDDGKLAAPPTVIERDIFESAAPGGGATPSIGEMQEAIAGQFEWMGQLRADYDANRSTEYLDVGPRRVEMVREIPGGIAVLTRVIADNDLDPPIHGRYLVEFDKSGGETRRIYLNPLEEDLDVEFRAFAPAPGGSYYLYASDHESSDTHVVLIDSDGKPVARSQLSTKGVVIEGIEADGGGVWLYGHAYIDKEPSRLYLERVAFD
jgi:hypothetical protein